MTLKQFKEKYGTHMASLVIKEIASSSSENTKRLAEELARDLELLLSSSQD